MIQQRVFVYQSGNVEVDRLSGRAFQYGQLQTYSQNIQNLNLPWNMVLQFYQPNTNYQSQLVSNLVTVRSSGAVNIYVGGMWYTFNVRITLRSTRMLDYWSTVLGQMGGQNAVLTILDNALDYAIAQNYGHSTYNIGVSTQPYILLGQFDIEISLAQP
jgi:hypothetical protein